MITYPLIFVLDCSGSMSGTPIKIINEAIKELPDLEIEYDEDVLVKVAVLSFATEVCWKTEGLVSINSFSFASLEAGGMTSLGAALSELASSLNQRFLLSDRTTIAKPVIIFMTDGYPSDDWETEMSNAYKMNSWLKHSSKLAIGFNDFNKDCLCELVDNNEKAIIVVDTVEQVKDTMLRLFSCSISDGASSILSSAIEKASRIMKNCQDNDDWLE